MQEAAEVVSDAAAPPVGNATERPTGRTVSTGWGEGARARANACGTLGCVVRRYPRTYGTLRMNRTRIPDRTMTTAVAVNSAG